MVKSITATETYIDNLLGNGSFDANIEGGWFGWGSTQSWDATGGTNGSGAVKIEVSTAGNIWDAVFAQSRTAVVSFADHRDGSVIIHEHTAGAATQTLQISLQAFIFVVNDCFIEDYR